MRALLQDFALMALIVVCAGAIAFVAVHLRAARTRKIRQVAVYKTMDAAIRAIPVNVGDRIGPKWRAGTVIQCPSERCGALIAVSNRDVFGIEVAGSQAWTWFFPHNGPGPRSFECPKCRALYKSHLPGTMRVQLHTTQGWAG